MSAIPDPDVSRTLIDLPVKVKADTLYQAQRAGSTIRLEIIAAMIAWRRNPDRDLRKQVTAQYDRRPVRGFGKIHGRNPE